MFTQLRQDITVRRQRLHQDVARARVQHRRAVDEFHLARAERPRGVTRLVDLIARYQGVTLFSDRVERGGESHRLTGVSARVHEVHTQDAELGTLREVRLVITGPDWEWTVRTAALYSSRRVRGFAALINFQASRAAGRVGVVPAPRAATATGQFRVLDELRGRGVLTDAEFAGAVARIRGEHRS